MKLKNSHAFSLWFSLKIDEHKYSQFELKKSSPNEYEYKGKGTL